MIYDNFVRLCASVGKSPSAVAQELGINKSTVSNWKRRKNGPSDVTLEKMVQYFNVPVSELTGEGQKKEPIPKDGLTELLNDPYVRALVEIAINTDEAGRKFLLTTAEGYIESRSKK